MSMRIVVPGPATTIQDRGRTGYQNLGFSPAGVMDWRAAALANAALGNDRDDAVLEFALAGPEVRFDEPARVALAGAEVHATLDGTPVPMYQAVRVAAGSTLRVGAVRRGQFGYLAVGGGIQTPPAMGSRSTSTRYGLGGLEGRRLRAGDEMPLVASAPSGPADARTGGPDGAGTTGRLADQTSDPFAEAPRVAYAEDAYYGWNAPVARLRVVPGPDEHAFGPEAVRAFYGEEFAVTAKSDRMGFRLDGPALETRSPEGIVSEGVALGTIQVPPHGSPIIVLADHQTVGGYAKMGTVATTDIPRLAQCPPGRRLRFERVSVERAQELLRADMAFLDEIRHRVRGARQRRAGTSDR